MQRFYFILIAIFIACLCLWLPVPEGLSPTGFMMLCVTGGVLILWISQAVDFSASAFFLIGLMALLGDLVQDPNLEQGAGQIGIKLAMQGFASSAWVLVTAALFLAAAVDISGLGRRIGFFLFTRIGATPHRVRLGGILLIFIFSTIIPSPAACAGLGLVILASLVDVFGISRKSNLSKGLFLTVGLGPMLSSLMIMTAGGAPMQTTAYILKGTGHELTWMAYALYGFPMTFGLFLSFYFLLEWFFPLGDEQLKNGEELVAKALASCGKMCLAERWVLGVILVVIPLWITSKVLHPMGNGAIAVLAVATLCAAGSVYRLEKFSFNNFCDKVPWGTLMLFGAVLSLGQGLLETGAASWITHQTLVRFGLADLPLWGIVVGGGALYGLFSLAFSVRSAAIAALTPTIIAFAQSIPEQAGVPTWGLSLILCYMVQFPVVLPAHSPMAMIAYSSNSFSTKDMAKVGGSLMVIALILLFIFSKTVWVWMGVL